MSARPALAALALLGGCGSFHSEGDFVPIGELSLSASATAARALHVNNPVGSIHVVAADGDEVSVHARVFVRESRLTQFPAADAKRDLDVAANGELVVVASRHVAGNETSDWRLDLEITAPRRLAWEIASAVGEAVLDADGSDVSANVSVGSIVLRGRTGSVSLATATGSIDADVESLAGGTLRTATGQIRLRARGPGPTRDLSLTTSTGSISIALPRTLSASVDLSTTIGSVTVRGAPQLARRGSITGQAASGRLGSGGPSIVAVTAVGSIDFVVAD